MISSKYKVRKWWKGVCNAFYSLFFVRMESKTNKKAEDLLRKVLHLQKTGYNEW